MKHLPEARSAEGWGRVAFHLSCGNKEHHTILKLNYTTASLEIVYVKEDKIKPPL